MRYNANPCIYTQRCNNDSVWSISTGSSKEITLYWSLVMLLQEVGRWRHTDGVIIPSQHGCRANVTWNCWSNLKISSSHDPDLILPRYYPKMNICRSFEIPEYMFWIRLERTELDKTFHPIFKTIKCCLLRSSHRNQIKLFHDSVLSVRDIQYLRQ